MIDIRFEINGKPVDPKHMGDALEQELFEGVRDELVKKVRGVRDPETGQPPALTVRGKNLENLTIEVHGSEAVIAEVQRRLA